MRSFALAAGVWLVVGNVLGSVPAMAAANRTYVSSKGDDSNPCTATSPCRTFQVAHDATNPGGEIMVLDPGGYGPVTITKAISIIDDGVGEAGIIASGITINAGGHDVVNLIGLTLTGVGVNSDGIVFNTGGGLNIQHCLIQGYNVYGIWVYLGGPVPTLPVSINISDTIVRNNNSTGIRVDGYGTAGVNGTFTRVQVIGNGSSGISWLAPGSGNLFNATVSDSVAANNDVGFEAGSVGATPTLMVVNSQAVNNATGVQSNGLGATVLLAGDTITGNTFAAFRATSSGVINSFGNNYIKGNPGGDGGAITLVSEK